MFRRRPANDIRVSRRVIVRTKRKSHPVRSHFAQLSRGKVTARKNCPVGRLADPLIAISPNRGIGQTVCACNGNLYCRRGWLKRAELDTASAEMPPVEHESGNAFVVVDWSRIVVRLCVQRHVSGAGKFSQEGTKESPAKGQQMGHGRVEAPRRQTQRIAAWDCHQH